MSEHRKNALVANQTKFDHFIQGSDQKVIQNCAGGVGLRGELELGTETGFGLELELHAGSFLMRLY